MCLGWILAAFLAQASTAARTVAISQARPENGVKLESKEERSRNAGRFEPPSPVGRFPKML
jgi:hypothetical protein